VCTSEALRVYTWVELSSGMKSKMGICLGYEAGLAIRESSISLLAFVPGDEYVQVQSFESSMTELTQTERVFRPLVCYRRSWNIIVQDV